MEMPINEILILNFICNYFKNLRKKKIIYNNC